MQLKALVVIWTGRIRLAHVQCYLFRLGCARKQSPGVYGRVSAVLPWIHQNVCEYAAVKPDFCFDTINSTDSDIAMVNPMEEGHELELKIHYDANPNQVAWILVNKDTDAIIDYVTYGAAKIADANVNIRYENLVPGHYTFLVTDSAGNGICCTSGNGSIEISEILPDGSTSLKWISKGNYGAGTVGHFELVAPAKNDVSSGGGASSTLPEVISATRVHDGGDP